MIYPASKTIHAALWRKLRETLPIRATWIDQAEPGQAPDMGQLWVACVREAVQSKALFLYVGPGDVLKGALVEVGAALAAGVRIYVVGKVQHSWTSHPLVSLCSSLDDAIAKIKRDLDLT